MEPVSERRLQLGFWGGTGRGQRMLTSLNDGNGSREEREAGAGAVHVAEEEDVIGVKDGARLERGREGERTRGTPWL